MVTGANADTRSVTTVRLEEFDYELPPERIAQVPIEPRDAARLLVDRGSEPPERRTVADLPDLLCSGDVVVVNDTRVLPARLRLRRATGGAVEVLLLEALGPGMWEALVRPARRLRDGEDLPTATDSPSPRSSSERRQATRSGFGCTMPRRRTGSVRCHCRPTSPRARPTRALPTVYARQPGQPLRRRPGCTSRPN